MAKDVLNDRLLKGDTGRLVVSLFRALEVWERTMQTRGLSETMEESLLTRRELADRWKVSIETIKRRERARVLRPLRLEGRIVRYRMSDVVRIEMEGDIGAQGGG